MRFNSFEYLLFLPLVSLLFFLVPSRFRWALLLAASAVFYMAFIPQYVLILLFLIIIDYTMARCIENAEGQKKKVFLVVSILSTCAMLLVFKYFNFFSDNISGIAHFFHWNYSDSSLRLILPIGLSFHTFQSLSYVIEVFSGRQRAERHFGIYALYVMFFPQLVAGPIERPQNLLRQFHEEHRFDFDRMVRGLLLIGWGLFKKSVIADRLAIMVNPVYNAPAGFDGISLLTATVFFAFQIYCDFSGYSDIAVGSAEILGFRLMTNFRQPYLARSVSDFWRRWHISLSTWFRDYIYFPLGGSRVSSIRWVFIIMTVFLVSGLWHGANWTFVIWGALHGCYMIVDHCIKNARTAPADRPASGNRGVPKTVFQIAATFSLVTFAWIFFRANTVDDAWYIVSHLFSGWGRSIGRIVENKDDARSAILYLGQTKGTFFFSIAAIAALLTVQWQQQRNSMREIILNTPVWIRWAMYYLLISSILILGVFQNNEFIYFQF